MSEVTRDMIVRTFKIDEYLLPNDPEHRILDHSGYALAWIGGSIYIGIFMLGSSLVPPAGGLNLLQSVIAMIIGLSAIAVCYNLNGMAGNKYGIPMVIQARSAFGTIGMKFPVLIRAVPALFWYGVQSWVGSSALNAISAELFGFESIIFWFVAFQVVQIAISMTGFKGIKIVNTVGSVFIMGSLIYMCYIIYTVFGSEISDKIIKIPGTWGYEFWVAIVTFIGVMTAMMLNISDYTREYKKTVPGYMFIAHWIGSVPVTMFMALVGLMAAGVTGQWDPVALFVDLLPNSVVLVIALLFVAVAQITTNIMLNVIPPSYIMMEFWGIKYKWSALITGLIAPLTCPWNIMNAKGFFFFIQAYSLFLGPIFAVLITDYYIIRKGNLDLMKLYNPDGPYKGVNWAGIIAMVVGAAIGGLIDFSLAWAISIPPSMLIYYVLMRNTDLGKKFLPEYEFQAPKTSVKAEA